MIQLVEGARPGSEMRLTLLKRLRELGMSAVEAKKIVEPMIGKTEPEKEAIAERLLIELEEQGNP